MTALSLRRARRLALPVAVLAVLALPACSSSSGSSSGSSPDAVAAAAGQAGGGGDDAVDGCSLLEAGEVQALVPGAPAEGEAQGGGSCLWEDPTTYNSVSLHIGDPETAAGGQLPPAVAPGAGYEDGPDGIRFSMGGTVAEFVADGRACDVQVVNGKDVKDDLVVLVGKLKSRVET